MENTYLEDLDGEIWKEIDGYNGIYFISNKGRVKSYLKYANGEIIGKNSSSVILKDSDGKRTYFNKAKLLNDYFTKIDYNADLDGEIWKDVKGYEGLYKVSNKGRVKSYSRYEEGRILKQNLNVGGYYVVGLTKDRKNVPKTVHRLVAEAFIPNPNNYPVINHKDEVKTNNNVDNLEWCTVLYNNTYGDKLKRDAEAYKKNNPQRFFQPHNKKIEAYNIYTNELVGCYPSVRAAARELNINHSGIFNCLAGRTSCCHEYTFKAIIG